MGVFFLVGAVLAAASYPQPGVDHAHTTLVTCLIGAGLVAGLASFVIPWERAPTLLHGGALLALALIAVAVAASGGVHSPFSSLYLLTAAYVAYFFSPRAVLGYLGVIVVLALMPVWFTAHPSAGGELARYLTAGATLVVVILTLILTRLRLTATGESERDRAAEATALRTVATALAASTDARSTAQVLFAQAHAMLGTDRGAVYRITKEGRELEVIGTSEFPGLEKVPMPLDPTHSAAAVSAVQDRTLAVDEALGHPLVNQDLVKQYGVASLIFVPLRSAEEMIGVLVLAYDRPHAFSQEEVVLAEALAAEAGLALARSELIESLDRMARTDELTKVANRRDAERQLDEETSRAERYGTTLSVLVIDLDHLKQTNDTQGHAAGDLKLQRLGRTLADRARATDLVGRWGGDEFVVVCPSTDAAASRLLAESIHALCAEHDLSVSIGIATREEGELPNVLLRRADDDLYAAKQAREGEPSSERASGELGG